MPTGAKVREYPFNDGHFALLQELARREVGIELNDSKRELVYGRLARRLRELGLGSFDEYCQLVAEPSSSERGGFVNAITTNVTAFFREDHHFDFLGAEALPTLMAARRDTKRLRLWSSACSTGQEPYSMAMTLADTLPPHSGWDWKVLATDIDSNAVARGNAGRYGRNELPDLSSIGDRRKWFDTVGDGEVQMADSLRQSIYFRVLNLMEPWPMSGPIDVIFCRNVVIYFSAETQRELFTRFAELLAPDGYLFIGHSESMLHSTDLFETVGRTVYRRRGVAG